jgi:hypothetical protein
MARFTPKQLADALRELEFGERMRHGPGRSLPGQANASIPGLPAPTFHPRFQTDPVFSKDLDTGGGSEVPADYFRGIEDDLPRSALPPRAKRR